MADGFGVGVGIGSTATKAVVLGSDGDVVATVLEPTGFSSVDAAERVRRALRDRGFEVGEAGPARCVATGYGRIAVPYADDVVTEITCHGIGASRLFGGDGVVVDVGGQDTKVIRLRGGRVVKFAMNDKCAAGTGRFLEIMADRLGVSQERLSALARMGSETKISSMCTVFAESEVISLIGRGVAREDIARGVIDSVVSRVSALVGQAGAGADRVFLTGGLCENAFVAERLGEALGGCRGHLPHGEVRGGAGGGGARARLVRDRMSALVGGPPARPASRPHRFDPRPAAARSPAPRGYRARASVGAGDGNRTRVISLEG